MEREVRFLKEIVSIPSPTGQTDDVVKRLLDWCGELGLEALERDGALIINPDGRKLLLIGHLDTVPGKIPVRIEKGELWGRGSVDAKGPLCAAISALCRINDGSEICIVAAPDEEGSSSTAERISMEWEPRPTIILEPSGSDGITIQYNGRLLIDLTARTCRSHSGADQPFAAEYLFSAYSELKEICYPRILHLDGRIDEARMRLDIRYENEPDLPKFENISIDVVEKIGMHRSDKRSALVRSFLRSMRVHDLRPIFKRKTGTCDMNILGNAWDTPILAYGPGDGKLDHTDEERISIEEYLRSIEVLEGVLRDILTNG
jgi:LysW-gamma-L-lysine carboxypeptidase